MSKWIVGLEFHYPIHSAALANHNPCSTNPRGGVANELQVPMYLLSQLEKLQRALAFVVRHA